MKRAWGAVPVACLVAWSACTGETPAAVPVPLVPGAPGSAAMTTARATDRFPTAKGELVVSPLEHASLLFGWDGKAVYVDPTSPAVADESLPKADVVFVTEARFDHLDAVAVERVSRPGTIVVGPARVAGTTRVHRIMKNGDAREILGIGVTAVPMYNLERGPAPGLRYHDEGDGNGYLLDFGGTRVYVSGDTECAPETMAIERVDVAFLAVREPIAMTPSEAARCVEAFRPKVVFPYHGATRENLSELRKAATRAGVDVRERDFHPRPEHWRRNALEACAHGQWGVCRDHLDLAEALDPLGETDPRVVHAREQVRAWQSPFPPWW